MCNFHVQPAPLGAFAVRRHHAVCACSAPPGRCLHADTCLLCDDREQPVKLRERTTCNTATSGSGISAANAKRWRNKSRMVVSFAEFGKFSLPSSCHILATYTETRVRIMVIIFLT